MMRFIKGSFPVLYNYLFKNPLYNITEESQIFDQINNASYEDLLELSKYFTQQRNQAEDGWWGGSLNYLPEYNNNGIHILRQHAFDTRVKSISDYILQRLSNMEKENPSLAEKPKASPYKRYLTGADGHTYNVSDVMPVLRNPMLFNHGKIIGDELVDPSNFAPQPTTSVSTSPTPPINVGGAGHAPIRRSRPVSPTTPATKPVATIKPTVTHTTTPTPEPLKLIPYSTGDVFPNLKAPTIDNYTNDSRYAPIKNAITKNKLDTSNTSGSVGNDKLGVLGQLFRSTGKAMPTLGDMLAAYGTFKGMNDAKALTLQERATSTPNINHYKDFGKQGLYELNKNEALINQSANRMNAQVSSAEATANSAIRNSARGINTHRALMQQQHANATNQRLGIENSRSQQLSQLYGQRSNLLNQIDQMVMQGEAQRDLADRQDRGTFYSNLSQNEMDIARGIQHLGGMINHNTQNNTMMNLMAKLSQYGFELDRYGNLTKKQ